MNAVDIGLFDYDRHNALYYFALNADEQTVAYFHELIHQILDDILGSEVILDADAKRHFSSGRELMEAYMDREEGFWQDLSTVLETEMPETSEDKQRRNLKGNIGNEIQF